jgi:hypothetical protein
MRSFITCTPNRTYLSDQVKEDDMDRKCSTNGGEEECIEDIGRKARRKETTRKTET